MYIHHRQPAAVSRTVNTTVIIGGNRGCWGNHCCNRASGTLFALGMLTGVLGSLFNKGNNTQVIQQQQNPYQSYQNYNLGYNAGLYTPGSSSLLGGGYNAGYNAGLYNSSGLYNNNNNNNTSSLLGQYNNLQGQYGTQQTEVAFKANELDALVKDLRNDYGFTFNNDTPKLTADGQGYSYDAKTFDTITDLRNYIEDKNGLQQKKNLATPRSVITSDEDEIVVEDPIDASELDESEPTDNDETEEIISEEEEEVEVDDDSNKVTTGQYTVSKSGDNLAGIIEGKYSVRYGTDEFNKILDEVCKATPGLERNMNLSYGNKINLPVVTIGTQTYKPDKPDSNVTGGKVEDNTFPFFKPQQ